MNSTRSRDVFLVEVADIDHSRLAHEAGSPMPPAKVLIFSDAKLESQPIQLNPLLALDLPSHMILFGGPGQVNRPLIPEHIRSSDTKLCIILNIHAHWQNGGRVCGNYKGELKLGERRPAAG